MATIGSKFDKAAEEAEVTNENNEVAVTQDACQRYNAMPKPI
jgi:hypothetical protein